MPGQPRSKHVPDDFGSTITYRNGAVAPPYHYERTLELTDAQGVITWPSGYDETIQPWTATVMLAVAGETYESSPPCTTPSRRRYPPRYGKNSSRSRKPGTRHGPTSIELVFRVRRAYRTRLPRGLTLRPRLVSSSAKRAAITSVEPRNRWPMGCSSVGCPRQETILRQVNPLRVADLGLSERLGVHVGLHVVSGGDTNLHPFGGRPGESPFFDRGRASEVRLRPTAGSSTMFPWRRVLLRDNDAGDAAGVRVLIPSSPAVISTAGLVSAHLWVPLRHGGPRRAWCR